MSTTYDRNLQEIDDLLDLEKRYEGQALDARERLAYYGPENLSDQDLYAILLGSGIRGKNVNELAREVMDKLETTSKQRLPGDTSCLVQVAGVGTAKATLIAAALELGRRTHGYRGQRVLAPKDLWTTIAHYADRKQERFLCCTFNAAHELISTRVVSVGLVNRTIVHPREVFADAITDRACAIIIAHNHPSGALEPSEEDINVTVRLIKASIILGVKILDHIIFSAEGYYSFMENKKLNFFSPYTRN